MKWTIIILMGILMASSVSAYCLDPFKFFCIFEGFDSPIEVGTSPPNDSIRLSQCTNCITQNIDGYTFNNSKDFVKIKFESDMSKLFTLVYTLPNNAFAPKLDFNVFDASIAGQIRSFNTTVTFNRDITTSFNGSEIVTEQYENGTEYNRTEGRGDLIPLGGKYYYSPKYILTGAGNQITLTTKSQLISPTQIKYMSSFIVPLDIRMGDQYSFQDPLVTQCTNSSDNSQLDLNANIYHNSVQHCFKLNYTGTILDGHGFNVTQDLSNSLLINISGNNTVVRSLNLTQRITGLSGLTAIRIGFDRISLIDNVTIYNITTENSGSTSRTAISASPEIGQLGNITHLNISDSSLKGGAVISIGTSNPFSGLFFSNIFNNNLTATGSSCIALATTSQLRSSGNLSIFRNNCSSPVIGATGIVSLGNMLNSYVGWNSIVSTSTASSSSDASTLYLASSAAGAGTETKNNVIENNNATIQAANRYSAVLMQYAKSMFFKGNKLTSLTKNPSLRARNSNGIISINDSFFTNHIGILLNGSGTASVQSTNPTKNLTFINGTIMACSDDGVNACGVKNITSDILFTENVTDVFMQDMRFNKSKITFRQRDGGDGKEKNNITVQWTLDINVTDANGAAITTAFVAINNSLGQFVYNATVNSLGAINSTLITEFTQNGTINSYTNSCVNTETGDAIDNITCMMPLNISVTATGYNPTYFSFYLNATNKTTVQMTATGGGGNTCTCPTSGDWTISDGSICNLTTSCFIHPNNFYCINGGLNIYGSGILTAKKCFGNILSCPVKGDGINGKMLCGGG